ncbi:MAG: TetR/AcrR family transcriptional regulator [Microlunatus sp.]
MQSQAGRGRKPNGAARAELLDVATAEFARVGYHGARVDEIAARSSTTKRMIYYYFGDKDGLFTAVLERVYAEARAGERKLDLSGLPPLEAIARLIEHTVRWHASHPELSRLVSAENALGGVHLRRSTMQASTNLPVVELMDDILASGRASGEIVRDVSGLDLHLHLTALALFQVNNAATIEATFGVQLQSPEHLDRTVAMIISMITTWLTTP